MLRPALQLALDVARIAAASPPAVEPPRAVKPFLHFTRLPDQALVAVRRALDEDEDFRSRVELLADESELGRAGWLFLVRPQGWEDELSELTEQANIREHAEREEREERSARRRLRHAEEATERAVAAAARTRAESAKAAAELAVERRERRAAQEEAARTARRATSLEGERDSARRRAAEATAEAESLRAEVASLRTDLMDLRTQLTEARTEQPDPPEPPVPPPAGPAGPAEPVADVRAAAAAVAAAAVAASSLARALGEVSVALGSPPPGAPGEDTEGRAAALPGLAHPPVQPPKGRPRPSARRRPVSLPPAVFDDTVEAANHLVRVPEVLFLVDGYNAAKALWPDVGALELRERLVDALSELEARTGADVHVVFDGADIGGPASRPGGRRAVRVSFSPSEVEADDVILALVDEIPVPRPVVVATSDRRVQDGARARGANVISSAQLAAVLGRA